MNGSASTPPLNSGECSPVGDVPSLAINSKPSAPPPLVPDYDLLRRIGGGAYGEVWLARSKATGVLRAAKIVWRRTFEDDRPFQREFDGIQRFERISREHPGQLALFHIGRNSAEGYFYYVMELADDAGGVFRTSELYAARTLRADLKQERLSAERVLEIGLVLAEALGHLHNNGLVHRDVKPSNVIFVNGRPKLADIGLVTDASDQCSIVGTEGYLPLEGPGTAQADIFALGKVLYEAATGLDRREFPKLPEDIRSWPDAKLVFELNEVIIKASAQSTNQRYSTCDEMHAELALLNRGKSVKRKRTRQQQWVICKRTVMVLIVLLAAALLVSFLSRNPKRVAANLCDKGMTIVRSDDYANLANAYMYFKEAIALDPNSIRAYVGLLELARCEPAPRLPEFTVEDFKFIATNLERLAPNSAATHWAQSVVNWNDWNFSDAVYYAEKAINADRNYEPGQTWYAWLLLRFGLPEEARQHANISKSLAPHKAIVYRTLGDSYFAERDYSNAIAQYQIAMQLESHPIIPCREIGWAYQAMDDYTNAMKSFDQANNPDPALHAALAAGKLNFWQELWGRTKNDTNEDFYWKAVVRIHLGDTNGALDWLQQSYTRHEVSGMGVVSPFGVPSPMGELLFYGGWNDLQNNPDFTNLLNQVGFTKVQFPRKK